MKLLTVSTFFSSASSSPAENLENTKGCKNIGVNEMVVNSPIAERAKHCRGFRRENSTPITVSVKNFPTVASKW